MPQFFNMMSLRGIKETFLLTEVCPTIMERKNEDKIYQKFKFLKTILETVIQLVSKCSFIPITHL